MSFRLASTLYVVMAVQKANGAATGTDGPRSTLNGHAKQERAGPDERTDINKWRLRDDRGRQTWHYLESDEEVAKWPQTIADRHFLNLPTVGALVFNLFPLRSLRMIQESATSSESEHAFISGAKWSFVLFKTPVAAR